ncbi:lipocalin family protein [Persicitalea sp.]|uniref:lipocalin family protein n=1 Tax=Persicitalea sp. TaxID=3100273 RepID=UPI003593EA95
MRSLLYFSLLIVFLLVSCRRKVADPQPEVLKLEGYWKLKSYTVDPPLAGGISDLTSALDPCALQVTYHFRPDGTTMFLDAPQRCKDSAKSSGIDLDTDPVSNWKFEGENLVIFDSPTSKEVYEYKKIGTDTMTWTKPKTIPLSQDLGGDQKLSLIMTFVRAAR